MDLFDDDETMVEVGLELSEDSSERDGRGASFLAWKVFLLSILFGALMGLLVHYRLFGRGA